MTDEGRAGPADGALPGSGAALELVAPLAERFRAHGYRLYLVGGVVRDLAVAARGGIAPTSVDIDLTTDARPAEIKSLLSPLASELWTQGERFGTIAAMLHGTLLEVTTHRAEAYDKESRKPVVTFGDRLQDDLSRRDFTINAVALEIPGGELHDPFQGLADLEAGVLRTPLSPETSFTDDPLRMLRAARFIPRFDLTPDPLLVKAARSFADRLSIVSVERIADELSRLLAVEAPGPGWDFLVETGLFTRALAGFSEHLAPGELSQCLEIATALGSADASVAVRRAGLLWPLGPTPADRELARLKFSRADRSNTAALLNGVAAVVAHQGPIEAKLVRTLAAKHGAQALSDIVSLAVNLSACLPTTLSPQRVAELSAAIAEVGGAEDLDLLNSPLSGTEIMSILDIGPGPMIGEASTYLRQLRIEQGPITANEAQKQLVEWWSQHQ